MTAFESLTVRTREIVGTGSLCAVPVGSHGGGAGSLAELGPLALLVAGFAGVGIWMFRRYGGKGRSEAPAIEAHAGRDSDGLGSPGQLASA